MSVLCLFYQTPETYLLLNFGKRLYVIEKLRFQTENNSEPKRDSRLYEKRRHSNIMNRQLMLGYNG